jgi:endonuclease/exonuclease/phosphatase family metal-dependent hydrolase
VATRILALLVTLPLLIGYTTSLGAQSVGERVRLVSQNPQGVPVHPADGDNSYVRWQNGTQATIQAIGNWFRVEADDGQEGWVTRRYIFPIDEAEEDASPEDEVLTYTIGTWNLEHLRDGARRGFPESTHGGPSYPPRSDDDYQLIADVITTQLDAKILVLNEINGHAGGQSDELDRLVGHLGDSWEYVLGRSGGSQRVAILYDEDFVQRDTCHEFEIAEQEVEGKDVFARDPLACRFTLLDAGGIAQNDLLVIGLHLASGQQLNDNHNHAMDILRNRLHAAFSDNTFPADERDILIGGDLNASRYDANQENFWSNYDSGTGGFLFATLSPDDGTEYPGTRLAGVPLFPRSQIDYLFASTVERGLREELVQLTGEVHVELLNEGIDAFREHVSDHLPVTVRIRAIADTDVSG